MMNFVFKMMILIPNLPGTPVEPWTPPKGYRKNPAFLLRNPAFLLRNPAFLPRNASFGVYLGLILACFWTGSLYMQHIKPLLPMKFTAALWDQGERDEKTTNTTWYSTEFPKLITGWRAAFKTLELPFVYVEICHENGAEEPKEKDFWEFGMVPDFYQTILMVIFDCQLLTETGLSNAKW